MKKQGTWLLNNFNISCNLKITASILTMSRLLCIFCVWSCKFYKHKSLTSLKLITNSKNILTILCEMKINNFCLYRLKYNPLNSVFKCNIPLRYLQVYDLWFHNMTSQPLNQGQWSLVYSALANTGKILTLKHDSTGKNYSWIAIKFEFYIYKGYPR